MNNARPGWSGVAAIAMVAIVAFAVVFWVIQRVWSGFAPWWVGVLLGMLIGVRAAVAEVRDGRRAR